MRFFFSFFFFLFVFKVQYISTHLKQKKMELISTSIAAIRLITYGLHPAVNISTQLLSTELIIVTFLIFFFLNKNFVYSVL